MKILPLMLLMVASLCSCKDLETFPADDQKTSSERLEICSFGYGEWSRSVITDRELVNEYYKSSGREGQGPQVLKEQIRLQLSPEDAHWFWQYVDRARVLDWSDDDMPTSTNRPSLTYRKGSKEIHLPISHGTNVEAPKFSDLNKHINELERRTQSVSSTTNSKLTR